VEFERDVTIPLTQPLRHGNDPRLLAYEKRRRRVKRVVRTTSSCFRQFQGVRRIPERLADEKLMKPQADEESDCARHFR